MVTQELLNYVKKSKEQGIADWDIKQSLLANGWFEADIDAVMIQTSTPEVPKGPGLTIPSRPATISRQTRNYEIYSMYSVFLAIVLFFGLFSLATKVINDVGRH